jgi:hypothetical protein
MTGMRRTSSQTLPYTAIAPSRGAKPPVAMATITRLMVSQMGAPARSTRPMKATVRVR